MYVIGQAVTVKWFDGLEESGIIKKVASLRENETTYYYTIEENGKSGTACFTNINIDKKQCTID